ncbi:hypothetical protein Poli38472_013835 [Pythium oligandrum]|uniref:Uncharacterized protein n=1 Tax=Pythium oligandrum TaxID=41045 RepID=A0A8K1C2B0_PYTOL|nr:hypothetical protein Poli38472_013835 [Pythium oligandrum]|eukprot:TMW55073.1 hypothetical protein Poli38472_013835 [Pythium oligandrum]
MTRRGGGSTATAATGASARHGNASQLEKLREDLLRALQSTIVDTVDTVCEDYEESFAVQAATQERNPLKKGKIKELGPDELPEYDLYRACCNRLVTYIAENMVTSVDFAQQMDRLILACHSNASEKVLRTVVTKSLWFHRKDEDEGGDAEEDEDDDEVVEVPPPARGLRESTVRSKKRRASAPMPVTHSHAAPAPTPKRARKDTNPTRIPPRKAQYKSEEDEEEQHEEEELEQRRRTPKPRRQNHVQMNKDEIESKKYVEKPGFEEEEEEEDEDDVVIVEKDAATQPHYGNNDELLKFKDAIGDMCYEDRRTPVQTKFFKDRLRKSIEFVDALLCRPPPGKVCNRQCKKIRSQMCNNDLPCRNKNCRIWHDVEAHTDHCTNKKCEFRTRIMLRETLHKIDHKKLEIEQNTAEVQSRKRELRRLQEEDEGDDDRENAIERRLLENEIAEFEVDIEDAEKEIAVYIATKKAYWASLNDIGITVDDDDADKFPDYHTHYGSKKAPAKKKAPSRPQREASDVNAAVLSPRAERSRRRRSGSGQLTDGEDQPGKPTVAVGSDVPRQRITRRSTTQSLQAMSNGVIELDEGEDAEHKANQSAEEDSEMYSYRPPNEPPASELTEDKSEESVEQPIQSTETAEEGASGEPVTSTTEDNVADSDMVDPGDVTSRVQELTTTTEMDSAAPVEASITVNDSVENGRAATEPEASANQELNQSSPVEAEALNAEALPGDIPDGSTTEQMNAAVEAFNAVIENAGTSVSGLE